MPRHKKTMKKIKNKKAPKVFTESQVGSLIESFRDDVKIVSENLIGMNERFGKFQSEMYGFRDEMYDFKNEMYAFRDEMHDFKNEMHEFKDEMYEFRNLTLEELDEIKGRLEGIEKDIKEIKEKLKNKADKEWVARRINKLEKEVEMLKKAVMKN